jgi:preprotein translocase SecE subunit
MSRDKTPADESLANEFIEDHSANGIERMRHYIQEVRREMKQVTWPTWNQVQSTTLVVLFFTFAMAIFLYAVDGIAMFLYQLVVKR